MSRPKDALIVIEVCHIVAGDNRERRLFGVKRCRAAKLISASCLNFLSTVLTSNMPTIPCRTIMWPYGRVRRARCDVVHSYQWLHLLVSRSYIHITPSKSHITANQVLSIENIRLHSPCKPIQLRGIKKKSNKQASPLFHSSSRLFFDIGMWCIKVPENLVAENPTPFIDPPSFLNVRFLSLDLPAAG